MKTKHRKFAAGFSLGEVLLSIAVLTAGILPIFASITHGIKISNDDQRIIVASGLAQEGVELIQNVRDNQFLHIDSTVTDAFYGWLPGGKSNVNGSWNNCRIDFKDPVLSDPVANQISCSGSSYDLTPVSGGVYQGLFEHGSTSGLYKRRLFLSYDAASKQLTIVSAVYWGTTFVPTTPAEVANGCHAASQCVSTGGTLTAWR
ncbi:MAG: hypothetical protein WCL23_04695 [Candidatus Moraniibacteriota bacterium]